ncbi:uncharacterized protein LOC120361840 [Saimiri boliviensis]|uniref:uncharacterized protein LOC120361840 n=1 Tax=Saimiri boliviensis TaxID=27679 RepID=UPI003D76ECAC
MGSRMGLWEKAGRKKLRVELQRELCQRFWRSHLQEEDVAVGRTVRCTYFSLEKLEEAGMLERPRRLRGLFLCLFAGLFWTQYSPKPSKFDNPGLSPSLRHGPSLLPIPCHQQARHILPARHCAAASLWSRRPCGHGNFPLVWPSAHQFLQLPWDSPGVSTASSSADWDGRSPTWQPVIRACVVGMTDLPWLSVQLSLEFSHLSKS